MAPNYIPTDIDHAQKNYEDHEAGKTRTVKPPQGKSVWFILPARVGASQGATPFLTGLYVHFVRTPRDPETVFAVGLCPSKTKSIGQPCPGVCQYSARMRKSGDASDEEFGERLSAREHILCNAVRLDVDAPKVEILQLPSGVYGDLNKILRDRSEGCDFTNPEKGRSVIIERTGTGKNDTEYSVRLSQREIKLPKTEWLDQMNDLDAVFEVLDGPKIQAAMTGEAEAARASVPASSAPKAAQVAAGEQKQLPASPAAGETELVEDPLTGEMVPASTPKGRR